MKAFQTLLSKTNNYFMTRTYKGEMAFKKTLMFTHKSSVKDSKKEVVEECSLKRSPIA